TGTGKVKRSKAYKSHILNKKTAKRKRNLRKSGLVSDSNMRQVKRMLGIG
ncbi:MAG: 50S ribosomal protein L35, partial [Bacillota bacterium]|nr:50S ribosomal protein L35 [Bacillota bacterium]